jgi:hypothetical protein
VTRGGSRTTAFRPALILVCYTDASRQPVQALRNASLLFNVPVAQQDRAPVS